MLFTDLLLESLENILLPPEDLDLEKSLGTFNPLILFGRERKLLGLGLRAPSNGRRLVLVDCAING